MSPSFFSAKIGPEEVATSGWEARCHLLQLKVVAGYDWSYNSLFNSDWGPYTQVWHTMHILLPFHICNISILLPCLNYAVSISHNCANFASSIQSCYPTVLTRGHTYWSLVRLPWKLNHSMQTWNQSKPENKWLSIPASSREAVDKAANCLLCEY